MQAWPILLLPLHLRTFQSRQVWQTEYNTSTLPTFRVSSLLSTFVLPLGTTADAQSNRKKTQNNKSGNFPTDMCTCGEPLEQQVITTQWWRNRYRRETCWKTSIRFSKAWLFIPFLDGMSCDDPFCFSPCTWPSHPKPTLSFAMCWCNPWWSCVETRTRELTDPAAKWSFFFSRLLFLRSVP